MKGPICISLIVVGKITWRYLVAFWRYKDTRDLISSIYGFYFQKLISRSFSELFKLFLLISIEKGWIFTLKT